MSIDLIFYAVVAAFLIYRLNSVLGARGGHERRNPFLEGDDENAAPRSNVRPINAAVARAAAQQAAQAAVPQYSLDEIVDEAANADGRVEQGLAEIAEADRAFDPSTFIFGARKAFEHIVTAYARGDIEALKPLLSPKLFADFSAGVKALQDAGRRTELIIHRVKSSKIKEAHLGGLMAYVTVMFEVEETTVTRDSEDKVVEGDPDSILTVKDVWSFTRDTRSKDPNWMLIETGVVEAPPEG
ncbi:MAG: Tim44/TimA family putative adaptor protein [Alphaproteobacteria bacterium]|nr:Tim44/TimA family putative adaptor protein [Alphaproteobacteria bacterium]